MKFNFIPMKLCMPVPSPTQAVGAGVYNGNKDKQNTNAAGQVYDGVGGTVTVQSIEDNAPGVLDQDLDRSLIQVRPYDNPIDTIVREIGNVEYITSMEPQAGSDGTLPVIDEINSTVTLGTSGAKAGVTFNIEVKNINAWITHDTFILNEKGSSLVAFYVYDIDINNKQLKCVLLNNTTNTSIAANTKLQRLATAVNERQAMIEANELLPDFRDNYCQIFMKTINVGTLALMHKKKVNVTFDSIKEKDIWDFRRQIESAFTFGVKGKIADVGDRNKTIYTCGGLWEQLQNNFNCPATMDDKAFITLTEQAFAYDNGSNTKILLGGHGLISKLLEGASYQRTMQQGNVQIVAGIKFNRIETSHGTLLVKPHHLFKEEHKYDGMILDPSYITKKYFHKTSTDEMDLLKAGIDRSKSQTLWEISTIFANNLPTHMRILGNANW